MGVPLRPRRAPHGGPQLSAGPILCVALPQLYRLVVLERCRSDDVLRRVACRAQDRIGVALQTLDDFLALQVPDVDHVVLAAGNDPLEKEKKT